MYALKNSVQLIGSIGGTPELKETITGKRFARFYIVTTEYYWNMQGDKVAEMQWHRAVAHGKVADLVMKNLEKGADIAVIGRLVSRSFPDKDGKRRTFTEIHINELLMIGLRSMAANDD